MSKTWKIIIAAVIVAIIAGGGVYYFTKSKTDVAQADASKSQTGAESNYSNAAYKFSLTFPASWGAIKETTKEAEEVSEIFKSIHLAASNDAERYIEIHIVKFADKNSPWVIDYPMTYLASGSVYSFYYTNGGDDYGKPGMEAQKYFDINKEATDIAKTFALHDSSSVTSPVSIAGWKTFTDTATGISFRYPATESSNNLYTFTQEWPPKVTISNNPISCTPPEDGNPWTRVNQKMINGRSYCVSASDDGTAGATYTTYNYSTELNGKLISLGFILKYPACDNFDAPKAAACKNEQKAFELWDGLIDKIAQTVTFTK